MRGKVRISATSDFGRNLLMHWLDEFNALYPEVTFALTLSDSLSNLVQEDIDLAIRFGVPQDSSLVARKLAPNRRVLCASPDYIARKGEPKDPNDLANFDCIVLGTASGPANEWRFTRGEEVQHYTVPFETVPRNQRRRGRPRMGAARLRDRRSSRCGTWKRTCAATA